LRVTARSSPSSASALDWSWRSCGYYSATVVVDDERVVLFGFGRRRTFRLADIRSAEVRVGTTGWGAYGRASLALNLRDGRTVGCTELNSRRPYRADRTSVVDDAVSYINATLSRAPGGDVDE
jgi:hypothetical protein